MLQGHGLDQDSQIVKKQWVSLMCGREGNCYLQRHLSNTPGAT